MKRPQSATHRAREIAVLKEELAELRESCERKQRIATVAMRDALSAHTINIGVCTMAAAAHHFLRAGRPGFADHALSALQAIENALLNEHVPQSGETPPKSEG